MVCNASGKYFNLWAWVVLNINRYSHKLKQKTGYKLSHTQANICPSNSNLSISENNAPPIFTKSMEVILTLKLHKIWKSIKNFLSFVDYFWFYFLFFFFVFVCMSVRFVSLIRKSALHRAQTSTATLSAMHYDISGSSKFWKGAVTDRNTPLLHVTHVLSGKNKKKAKKKIHKYLLSSESKSKNRCAKKSKQPKNPKQNKKNYKCLSQNSHKYIYTH